MNLILQLAKDQPYHKEMDEKFGTLPMDRKLVITLVRTGTTSNSPLPRNKG